MLSIMAVIFSVVVGLVLAMALGLVNMTGLAQIFALGFGIETNGIWLVGWNGLILVIAGTMIFAAAIAILLGNGNFGVKELARKLK